MPQGRELLRQLLIAPIRFTPFEKNGRRGHRFAGEALLIGLFERMASVTKMASLMPPVGTKSRVG